ncbi:hypothetical protein [Fulvimarina sp. MAC3]|uniref:hypothetical protein n=1 Tax=Fulvimarina sp. MAC3 TaxID=3148887 RepID=UPI0031FCAA53
MTSPIEKSIRRALEAGAPDSLKFRQGVYRAAERAVERVLTSETDDAQADAMRRELEEAVQRVEADYSETASQSEPEAPPEGATEASELFSDPTPSQWAPSELEPASEEPAAPADETIDPAFIPQPETRKIDDTGSAPIVHPEEQPEDPSARTVMPVRPDAPGSRRETPGVAAPRLDEPSRDDPRLDAAPSTSHRQPRAFAPPPPDGHGEPFEDDLDPAGITPSREPATRDPGHDGDGHLGPLSRKEDGLEGRDRHQSGDRRPDFDTWRPGSKRRTVKRRSKAGGILVSAVIICLIAFLFLAGAYLLAPFLMSATSSDAPLSAAEGESTEGAAGETQNWITVFSGREISDITTANGGRVTAEQAPDGSPVVRIAGPLDGGGGEIGFEVGPGVVAQLGGAKARAELTVGTTDGAERSFTVRCLFDGETRCGRQRFTTSMARESFIFAIDLSNVDENGGEIAIDPAIGDGNDLLVYELRLTANDGN